MGGRGMTNGEKFKEIFGFGTDGSRVIAVNAAWWDSEFQNRKTITPVPPHGRLKKCVVYRGDVFNAIEAARINALDGILTDRYKDGFHDGLKRALEILANEVQDVPTEEEIK